MSNLKDTIIDGNLDTKGIINALKIALPEWDLPDILKAGSTPATVTANKATRISIPFNYEFPSNKIHVIASYRHNSLISQLVFKILLIDTDHFEVEISTSGTGTVNGGVEWLALYYNE